MTLFEIDYIIPGSEKFVGYNYTDNSYGNFCYEIESPEDGTRTKTDNLVIWFSRQFI